MNQVERIFASWSIVSSRSAPTRPNSPREIALSELARNPPSHSEIASKSKLRQTEIFFSIMVTPLPVRDTSGSRHFRLGISSGFFVAREPRDLLESVHAMFV